MEPKHAASRVLALHCSTNPSLPRLGLSPQRPWKAGSKCPATTDRAAVLVSNHLFGIVGSNNYKGRWSETPPSFRGLWELPTELKLPLLLAGFEAMTMFI